MLVVEGTVAAARLIRVSSLPEPRKGVAVVPPSMRLVLVVLHMWSTLVVSPMRLALPMWLALVSPPMWLMLVLALLLEVQVVLVGRGAVVVLSGPGCW